VGAFSADGAGAITAGTADINAGGTVSSAVGFSGIYSVGGDGHGTMTLNFATVPATAIDVEFDVVSASRLLVLGTSSGSSDFLVVGEALKQSGVPFTNGALNGAGVLYQTGLAGGGSTVVSAGLVTSDGVGGFTLSADENAGGTLGAKSIAGTYAVAANGRTTTTETDGGNAVANPPVMYLVSANHAFVMATDGTVSLGSIEAQAGAPFDASSLSGTFLVGTAAPANAGVTLTSGVVAFAAGKLSGTEDLFVTSGGVRSLLTDQSVSDDYTVSANGRVTFAQGAVMYVISPNKAVAVDAATRSIPGLSVYEK
jgi:hypothetical protein